MTHYIIIEDERFAYEELKRMMLKLRPDYVLAGWAQGIEQAIPLVEQDVAALIIADIRLTDGLCFELFKQVPTDTPVIFTTAYDEYALKAFKVNSVDYLLKPIDERELAEAIDRFERNRLTRPTSANYNRLVDTYMLGQRKNRFLIRIGDEFRHVNTTDVACFTSEDKTVYLHTFGGKRYVIDYSLDRLQDMVDRLMFCRVSRGCIANIKAVKKVARFFGGRLTLTLGINDETKISVSRARSTELSEWLDGNRTQ